MESSFAGMELVVMLVVGLLVWVLPLAVAIWVIITLAGIRRDVAAIRQRIEELPR